jgi:glycosyltransferase involved in cell wall biosynthesis
MSKLKNILFIAEELDTNGAMMSLIALLKALSASNYNLSLFLFSHGGKLMQEIPNNVNVLPERTYYKVYRLPLKRAMIFALKKLRLDLMFFRLLVSIQRFFKLNFRMWTFLPKVPGDYDVACSYADGFVTPLMLRKVNAKRKCAWIHIPYSKYPQLDYVYDALKKVNICVPVSNDVRQDLFSILKCNVPTHVVHNLTDKEVCFHNAEKPCPNQRIDGVYRIVSVGRVTFQKYFDIIPSTAVKLVEKGIRFEWYIIGNGDQFETLCAEVDSKGLNEAVHFIGTRPNPMPWVKSADVIVIPSRFESWGMTVSEALCLGKAVITSDLPVFKEQITDGENGVMCHITPDNLANAIEHVLIDEEFRRKLEQNAVNYPFTKEVVVAEFEALVDKMLCREDNHTV